MERWAYEYFRRQAIEDRCKQEAQWLIDNPKDSIRKMAKEFCISKSQLHRDLHELRNIDDDLYVQCRNILRRHKRRCLYQSGNLTIWLNVNQIAKMEESRSSEELMGYSITTVDNKEYYSPDVKAIQALLIPLVVMEPEGDIVEELKKLDMRRNVMVEC